MINIDLFDRVNDSIVSSKVSLSGGSRLVLLLGLRCVVLNGGTMWEVGRISNLWPLPAHWIGASLVKRGLAWVHRRARIIPLNFERMSVPSHVVDSQGRDMLETSRKTRTRNGSQTADGYSQGRRRALRGACCSLWSVSSGSARVEAHSWLAPRSEDDRKPAE